MKAVNVIWGFGSVRRCESLQAAISFKNGLEARWPALVGHVTIKSL